MFYAIFFPILKIFGYLFLKLDDLQEFRRVESVKSHCLSLSADKIGVLSYRPPVY
jgi:hypothetical protein